jgi:opacity protein-like surface antigen
MGIADCRGTRFFEYRSSAAYGLDAAQRQEKELRKRRVAQWALWPVLACLFAASAPSARADDEIQVYTGEIVEVGKWTAQHHLNYAIQGRKEPDFPGGLIPNRTLNGTSEFAYGMTNWFEAGFYVPWAIDKDGHYFSNAMKLRALFVTPDAAKRDFFYGINFEFDYLMPKFADTRWGMEVRPIIGWRKGEYEFIMNPIVDLGFGRNGEVTFAPNARLARNFGEDFALALEYYTDLGPMSHFLPLNEQRHNVYGVVDFKAGRFEIEMGVGYGLTHASDRWMTKMMITTNLFDEPGEEVKQPQNSNKKLQTAKAPVRKAPVKKAMEPDYNYSGCYVGGYWGGLATPHLATNDPYTNAPYRVEFKKEPIVGGTLGCNQQARGSRFAYGIEGESGFMRLHATDVVPSNTDVTNSAHIGDWYGAIAGRAGFVYDRAWFYGKAGVGFTEVKSTLSGPALNASAGNSRAFWVAGGGIDWAWTGNWTLKMEYLFLGLDQTQTVCDSSSCANNKIGGIHTTKLGLNYKLY